MRVYAVQLAGKELRVCLDIVMNFSALRSGFIDYVREELLALARNTEWSIRKVIIETAYLNEEQKVLSVELIAESGMEFVKTPTGFAPTGATLEDVKLLLNALKGRLKVKASGGIKTKEQVAQFLSLGAQRIGTSNTFEILS
ncbi:hypothetical protein [Thermocrinis sp.]|uniref:2-deoxyribose-5-phosphate aldolase n=1 Tax=Thermocrinis sp. TaxID=2024383 RepID=UPI002FDEB6F4